MITCPAGHGDGQVAGYRVLPRTTVISVELVGLALFWYAKLKLTPKPISRVPESFQLGR